MPVLKVVRAWDGFVSKDVNGLQTVAPHSPVRLSGRDLQLIGGVLLAHKRCPRVEGVKAWIVKKWLGH